MEHSLNNHPDLRLLAVAIQNDPTFQLTESVQKRIRTNIQKSRFQKQDNFNR